MKIKHRLPVFLALVLLTAGVAFAHGSSEVVSRTSLGTNVTLPGSYPIVKTPMTLSVFVPANPLVENFATNDFTKWYAKKTGITVKWDVAPLNGWRQKLNLILASGNYPDVIFGANVGTTQQEIYGRQGVFIALNGYIAKYGTYTKRMFKLDPVVKRVITSPGGKIYALPWVARCFHCSMKEKMWIFEPWLKKLGLAMPTTTAQFERVLEAFKTRDPNGDGKHDEIPLAGSYAPMNDVSNSVQFPGNMTFLEGFLMNPFIYNDGSRMFLNKGTVELDFDTAGWREGLRYLHDLYAKGLIDPQSFTMNREQLKQLAERPGRPLLGAVPAYTMGTFSQYFGKSGRWLKYVPVPPLEGPNGRVAGYYPYDQVRQGHFIITKACTDPAAAFRWADYLYSREGTLRSWFGAPGKQWRWARPGEKGLTGDQAVYARLVHLGTVQNHGWYNELNFKSIAIRVGQVANAGNEQAVLLYRYTKQDYAPYKQSLSKIVPPLWFSSAQASQLANLSETINSYVNQMTVRFITGAANLDSGWAAYLEQLKRMGVGKYQSMLQQAYGRSSGR